MFPPLSPVCHVQVAQCAVWGVTSPPLPVCGVSLPPSPSPSPVGRTRRARVANRECPPLLRPLAARWGSPLPGWCVPLHPLYALINFVLLCGGSLPLPPLVDAHVNRALPFRGSLFLFFVLWLASREERALPVPFPRPRLPTIGSPYPCGLLRAVPAPLGTRGGWVAHRLLWRQ